jgi:hypothetical protein
LLDGFRPSSVAKLGVIGTVLSAVQLNNQTGCMTGEVSDVRSDWHLPAKSEPETTSA